MAFTQQTRVTRQDIKFWPSERLTDNDDGGGQPVGTPLTGADNELFNPISSIARLNGAFYARLVYMGIMRADAEMLIGSFAAITKPPKDLSTSYLLFRATKFGETRREILNRIESYNVGTVESHLTLYSTQTQNAKMIQAYMRPSDPMPLVGDVYCLRQDKKGYPQHEQYIKVSRVEATDRTFRNPNTGKDFVRTVVSLEISTKLEADFIGADYPSEDYIDVPCKIRYTNVADAAEYYGVKPLAAAIMKQTTRTRISSIFEKLVPTNQVELSLTDLTAAGQLQTLFDAAKAGADGVISLPVNKSHGGNEIGSYYFGNAVTPGSVVISTNSGDITDQGGTLKLGERSIGSIDYARGVANISNLQSSVYINSLRFRPAAAELRVADTAKIDIDINNRSYSYVLTLDPPPALGSLIVSYRTQGEWYDLRDDGTGALRGTAGQGSGTYNPTSGTVTVTCGALPDVGSAILFFWSTSARYFNRSGINTEAKMVLELTQDADPASLSLTWNDGTNKSASSDASGNITGDWTGKYDPQTRRIEIDTGAGFNHPNGVLDIDVTYNTGDKTAQQHRAPLRNSDGTVTIDLGDKPIQPNTFRLRWNLLIENYDPSWQYGSDAPIDWVDPYKVVRDDGAGNLLDTEGNSVGTVDYTNRTATFNPDTTVKIPKATYNSITHGHGDNKRWRLVYNGIRYIDAAATMPIDESALVEVWFYDTQSDNAVTEQLNSGNIEIDLLPNYAEVIAPSSVNVVWGGYRYFDRNGVLYTNLDTKTGAALQAGAIDYRTGKVNLNEWRWTNGAAPVVTSLVTSVNGNPVDAANFRTPASPIRPGSLQVRATKVDGGQISAIADYGGVIDGTDIVGTVDAEYGVVDLRFGELVTAAGNENEDWYNVDAVDDDGKIWRPTHVFAESITYNTVAYSYLPINSDIVKIDTVRLPQDGNVPIFRVGDSILISNSEKQDLGSAHTAGQTVQLLRDDLDRICLTDADGTPINAELWDYDLDAGSITWATPLDLSDYVMPITATHAREERNVVIDLNIDGTLSLRYPTKRAYPLDNTFVSSILIGGDLQVRHSVPFTQRNWDQVWRDEPNGAQLLNKLNLKDHPMVLTDDGAITDRWLIKMTGTTQFELYSETLGFVGRFDTLTDLAPLNPATSKPYFTIPHAAFGNDAPWAAQDVIRFNTWGTLLPVWVLCAQQPTSEPQTGKSGFTQCLYGDTTEITS